MKPSVLKMNDVRTDAERRMFPWIRHAPGLLLRWLLPAALLVHAGSVSAQVLGITTTKAFSPQNIATPNTSSMTITLATTVATNNLSITDSLPQTPGSMTVTSPGVTASTCGNDFTTAGGGPLLEGSTDFRLNNGAIAGVLGGSCSFSMAVRTTRAGTYVNTTGAPSGTKAGLVPVSGNTASASLFVYDPPVLTKVIAADHVEVGGDAIVTYTITNPSTNPGTLAGISFTDSSYNSIAKLVTTNGANTPGCGSGVSYSPPTATTLSVTGISLAPGGTCIVRIHVTGASAGTYSAGFSLSTGTLNPSTGTDNVSFGTLSSAPATLVVGPLLNVSKSFAASYGASTNDNVQTNAATSLAVTVQTVGTSSSISGLSITDIFPTTPGAMTVANNSASNTCGGSLTDSGGGTLAANDVGIKLAGGVLSAGPASCTFAVNIKAATHGTYTNTTGKPTGTYTYCLPGQNGTTVPCTPAAASGNTASDTLNVYDPPVFTKSFNASTIFVGGTSLMTIVITNPAGNPGTISGISFTDVLPTTPGQMKVAATPGTVATAAGTATGCTTSAFAPAAGATSVGISGLSLAAGASCTLKVNVTVPAAGTYANSVTLDNTGPGTSMSVSTGGGKVNFSNAITASANLLANSALGISKYFSYDGVTVRNNVVATNTTTSLVITLTSAAAATGITFTDVFPTTQTPPVAAGAMTLADNTVSNTCGGTVTDSNGGALNAGDTGIMLSGGTLTANGTCTVTVHVVANTRGVYVNTTSTATSSAGNAGPAVQNLNVYDPPIFTKSFSPSMIPATGTSTLTFVLTNPAGNPGALGFGSNSMNFRDAFPRTPTVMRIAATPNAVNCTDVNPSGSISATPNAAFVQYSLGTLSPGATCVLKVDVIVNTGSTLPPDGTVYANSVHLSPTGADISPMGVSIGSTGTTAQVYFGDVTATANLTIGSGLPALTVAKTVSTFADPINSSNPKAIPGATMLYAVSVSNSGSGSTTADSVIITDPIPANLTLCTGNSSGSTGLTVAFIDGSGGNASGLTQPLTAADISYSSTAGGGPPFTYVPAANSCDPAITGLRINPKGAMSGASGGNTPGFTLQFKAVVR